MRHLPHARPSGRPHRPGTGRAATRAALGLAATLALGACSTTDDDPATADAGSFLALREQVLTPTCATTGCHTTTSRAGGLVLDDAGAHAALVNVRPQNSAARADGLRLVAPGDPERSFLLHKVEMAAGHDGHTHGTADHGAPMPIARDALTDGQIAFLRTWIEKGAPRARSVADTALLRPAAEVAVPFAPLPAPASGLLLSLSPFTVAPRGEREVFVYDRLTNPDTLFVRRIDVRMRPGSHHYILYAQTAGGLTPGAVRDLGPATLLDEMRYFSSRTFLAGSQAPETTIEMPDGIVLPIAPGLGLEHNAHYTNPTAAPRTGEASVALHTVPRAPGLLRARVLNDGSTTFTLPPRARTVVERTTRFSTARRIFLMMSHTHKLAESFRVYGVGGALDGQLLYESLAWDHPPIKRFATPLAFAAGTGYRIVATYNNPTDRTVGFGFTSEDEMNILFSYYVR